MQPDMTTPLRTSLDIRSAIGDTGDHIHWVEHYEVTPEKGGTIALWQLHESRDPKRPGWFRGSCGWSGFASVVEFAAERQKQADKAAALALKHRQEAQAAQRRAEIAQEAVDAIRTAFDLMPGNWEWEMWATVGEEAGADLPAYIAEATALRRTPERLVAIRKLMRPLLTSAKENTREEYPEDYREADDKEDFYTDYADDIAESISQEVAS
jgi:hypothetical protein